MTYFSKGLLDIGLRCILLDAENLRICTESGSDAGITCMRDSLIHTYLVVVCLGQRRHNEKQKRAQDHQNKLPHH